MSTKYVQSKRAVLQGSINDTTTTCTLTGFLDLSGNPILQADIGETGFGTFEPNTDREEAVSFTIDSNVAGVAVLTITRGLLGKAPYGTGGTAFTHDSGTEFVMSNNPSLFNKMTAKDNDEVISGSWEFPAPTSGSNPANKDYVDSVVNGGAVSQNRVVVAGTAGATIALGDLVYFDETDAEWKRTAGATAATLNNVKLGIAQGAGVDGGAIAGGVLIYGLDSTQTGLTSGAKQYAGDVAGSIVETPGTIERCIGVARNATTIYFDANFNSFPAAGEKDAMAGGGNLGTPSASNKYMTQTGFEPAINDLFDAATFPVVEATATNSANNSSSISQTAPAGTVAGDLLLIFISSNSTLSSIGNEYTKIGTATAPMHVYAKIATGTDTFSATASLNSYGWATTIYRISNYWGSSSLTDIVKNEQATSQEEPPLLNPENRYSYYRWFAAVSHQNTGTYSAAPTGYSDLITTYSTDGDIGQAGLAVATKNLRAIEDNPDAFTESGTTTNSQAVTVSVRAAESNYNT